MSPAVTEPPFVVVRVPGATSPIEIPAAKVVNVPVFVKSSVQCQNHAPLCVCNEDREAGDDSHNV